MNSGSRSIACKPWLYEIRDFYTTVVLMALQLLHEEYRLNILKKLRTQFLREELKVRSQNLYAHT